MVLIDNNFQAPLSRTIAKEYNNLISIITKVPESQRTKKIIEGTGGTVSVNDLLSYQLGWGHLLVYWYQAGIQNQIPQMPGEGFSTWDYTELALYFYNKYDGIATHDLMAKFSILISEILHIVEKEYLVGNLDKAGVWQWCTLQSGKQWPLSKWVQVNTVAPYKRAGVLIKKCLKQLAA